MPAGSRPRPQRRVHTPGSLPAASEARINVTAVRDLALSDPATGHAALRVIQPETHLARVILHESREITAVEPWGAKRTPICPDGIPKIGIDRVDRARRGDLHVLT